MFRKRGADAKLHSRFNSTFANTGITTTFQASRAMAGVNCTRNSFVKGVVSDEAGIFDWSGEYSDSVESGGYGGVLRLCATTLADGTVLVEGLYSEVGGPVLPEFRACTHSQCCYLQIGYVRGIASGRTLLGEWFESVPSTSLGRGNFSLVLDVSGSYFTGTWWYGGDSTNVAGTWNEPRLSYTRPSNLQCFWTGGYTAGTSCGCALCAWRCMRQIHAWM